MHPNDLYLEWLVSLIDDGRADYYSMVLTVAWEMEFTYSIPLDANRALDGVDLRNVYERDTSQPVPELGPCLILEFLIALSLRINYILDDPGLPDRTAHWFWVVIGNLALTHLGPHNKPEQNREISEYAFRRVVNREYDAAGSGGLFPLRSPIQDQRKVEVWYQMHAWIAQEENQLV